MHDTPSPRPIFHSPGKVRMTMRTFPGEKSPREQKAARAPTATMPLGVRAAPALCTNPRPEAGGSWTGDKGSRTPDLHNAIVALYQLSYVPICTTDEAGDLSAAGAGT